MEGTLPAPRTLLTSLVNILASQPVPSRDDRQQHQPESTISTFPRNAAAQAPRNPLSLLPPNSRTLLTTLHVIYPSLLLPALDLLDRGLVTRVLVLDPSSSTSAPAPPSQELGEAEQARRDASASTFHLVRSAQQSARRGRRSANSLDHRRHDAGGGRTYVVRTQAWSCDCAAFAFGAFPVEPPPAGPRYRIDDCDGEWSSSSGMRGAETWEFGGLSFDGREKEEGGVGSGTPPCCKHLLASVLAERWGNVLGSYVQERKVGREEAAGLIGEL